MNRTSKLFAALALSLAVVGCKKNDAGGKAPAGEAKTAEAKGAVKTDIKAPAMVINEADWEVKDLHTIAKLINISMKVPKGAKMVENGNGGVDIAVSPTYMLTVSNVAISNVKEGIDGIKSMNIGETSSYINGKVISEEPNGFLYSMQMKTEENGNTYQPEAHFAFYVEKDGAIYSVTDPRPLDAFDAPGSTWSEDTAKKVYEIIKSSAKVN